MQLKDSIEKIIAKYQLPVSRGNQPVSEFLTGYYHEYLHDISEALAGSSRELRNECYELLGEKYPIIQELCSDILSIYSQYDSDDIADLHRNFNSMMEKVSDYLDIDDSSLIRDNKYKLMLYRIREGAETYSRVQMFHISMNDRHLIKSHRYSIPGYPCLYLANGLELCWFECGMPKKFNYCVFDLQLAKGERLKLINFKRRPYDFVSTIKIWYHNYPDKHDLIDEIVNSYLIIHPLRVACSLQVSNKNVSFIQEYIFPQLLLLWVRRSSDIDGIQYLTCSSISQSHLWNAENIVLPAKDIRDGYCQRLKDRFKLSEPIKIELSNLFQGIESKIEPIYLFISKLEGYILEGYYTEIFRVYLSLCKTFLRIYNCLKTDDYKNAEVLYQALETVFLTPSMITHNTDRYIDKAISDYEMNNIDVANGKKIIEELIETFRLEIAPIIDESNRYPFIFEQTSSIDESSFEFI